MVIKEIEEFSQIRVKARAYLCYILSRHLVGTFANDDVKLIESRLKAIQKAIPQAELVYVIDRNGRQIITTKKAQIPQEAEGLGADRSNRAYFYRTMQEKRCVITDPYPSYTTNHMVVTSAFPVLDRNGELLYIVCVDISLKEMLKMVHPSSIDSRFGQFSKLVYTAFSVALFGVALLLFVKGVYGFMHFGLAFDKIDINEMFKSTILLTLSLAIIDLVKAIFEEEVLGKERRDHSSEDTHQTMVRFLGSIIIALSIEALMLVFKFALTDPGMIVFAVILIIGVTLLIFSLASYLKASRIQDYEKPKKRNER